MPLSIQAHYDGVRVLFDEKVDIPPNTRLLVTILEDSDADRKSFLDLSSMTLADSYADDEIEYTEADLVK